MVARCDVPLYDHMERLPKEMWSNLHEQIGQHEMSLTERKRDRKALLDLRSDALIQRAREPNVRFAGETRMRAFTRCALSAKRRVMEMKIEAVTLDAEWGIAILVLCNFQPIPAMEGLSADAGQMELHVHYETSASWGAI